jgi:drug/metabolite transporter (DMT)-like permease
MLAVLPLIGGLLLGRFVNDLRFAAAIQAAFYAVAAAVLISTAPDHSSTHAKGAVLALVLAPVAAATLYLGRIWQQRATTARGQASTSVR